MTIQFKVENEIKEIKDLTIRNYYEIKTNLIVDNLGEKWELFSKLSGCTLEQIQNMPGEIWIEVWAQIEVMIAKSLLTDLKVLNKISHEGIKYGMVNFDEMSIGEFADLDIILSSEQADSKIHEVLAILYRPITKSNLFSYEIEPYDVKGFKERSQIFLDLPIKYAKAAISFFLCFGLASAGLTQTYLDLPKRSRKKVIEEAQQILLYPGTKPSLISQTKIFSNLTGQQNSEYENPLTTLYGNITSLKELNKKAMQELEKYNSVG